ncbi:MAG: hypothetical protein JO096_07435 [Alphaproteobacteria bacterium]|nr:hypothetical protein [Alphaproteobacteria bacterium]
MAYKGRGARDSNTIRNGHIPLWLAVHETGHVIACIHLMAAWNLNVLNNPACLESVRVWIDDRGKPRGPREWGSKSRFLSGIRQSSRRQVP